MNFDQQRRRADRLRSIPLVAVLHAAGAGQDRHDPAKWHTAQGVLSVNGAKFINWSHDRGGGGAIDLAMHLNDLDFRSAVQWLAQRFACPNAVELDASPPKPTLSLPLPHAAHLGGVKRYLVEERRLPDLLLESLIQAGQLYADYRNNAVFLLLGKEGWPVGAELRGTSGSWRGLAPGSRKDRGYFSTGPAHAQAAVLCESAIDAISCAAIFPDRLCISTAGARPNPAWLAPLLEQGRRIYCGFDADPAGDHIAHAMIAIHPAVQRLRPPNHDWNDALQASP